MAKRQPKIPKPRNPEARLLACPSLRQRIVNMKQRQKNDRSQAKRDLRAGRVPEGGADFRSVALSGIRSPQQDMGV